MKLEQKQFIRKRKFNLNDNSLKITRKDSSGLKEWAVDIENIGTEILIDKKSKFVANILGGFFVIFSLSFYIGAFFISEQDQASVSNVVVFGSFFLIIGILIIILPLKNELHIIGGQSQVSFLLDSPSRNEVEKYAHNLIEKSKEIIVKKYSKIDVDLPEETMMNQLHWLKNKNYISDLEYESKKREYKRNKLIN